MSELDLNLTKPFYGFNDNEQRIEFGKLTNIRIDFNLSEFDGYIDGVYCIAISDNIDTLREQVVLIMKKKIENEENIRIRNIFNDYINLNPPWLNHWKYKIFDSNQENKEENLP